MYEKLVSTIFEIERKIENILPSTEEMEWMDAGMFVDPTKKNINTLWRDYSYGMNGEEYSFSYSTNGGFDGDLPIEYKSQILEVLEQYKKNTPLVEISNVPDDK